MTKHEAANEIFEQELRELAIERDELVNEASQRAAEAMGLTLEEFVEIRNNPNPD